MVRARDAHHEWHEDEGRYGDPHDGRPAGSRDARGLELVRPTELAFELVAPEGFEAAQTIADRLREGRPVLIDFHGCDPRLTGRLMDFASGLVYALEGTLQHVGDDVVLLSPDAVDLSGDEAAAVRSPGFYNRI